MADTEHIAVHATSLWAAQAHILKLAEEIGRLREENDRLRAEAASTSKWVANRASIGYDP